MKVVELNPFTQKSEIRKLIARCSQPNTVGFFHSWPWVETWIDTLPDSTPLKFMWFEIGEDEFGGFVGERTFRNYGIKRTKHYLHETGIREYDVLVQEFNRIYSVGPMSDHQLSERLKYLLGEADELVVRLSNVIDVPLLERYNPFQQVPYYSVSMCSLRSRNLNYQTSLPRRIHKKVSQSIRAYSKHGQLCVEVATTTQEALDYFDKMGRLSIGRWAHAHQKSAFAYPYFQRFHRALINTHFADGCISLLKLTAGNRVIGYLYNFIDGNNVLFYQCGFEPGETNHYRPGYLCHTLAIEYYLANGSLDNYHFLAGEQSYKKELGTRSGELVSYTLSEIGIKYKLVQLAKRFKGAA